MPTLQLESMMPPRQMPPRPLGKRFAALALGTGCLLLGGCVERSITLATAPRGALAYLNDREVGRTPCRVPFLWYGNYDVRFLLTRNVGTAARPKLVHYYLHTHRETKRPWFQWIGPDLIAAILPIQFKDNKLWAFDVPRLRRQSDAQMVHEARALQSRMRLEAKRVLRKSKARGHKGGR